MAEQVPAALALGPDLASIAVGVNDSLRPTLRRGPARDGARERRARAARARAATSCSSRSATRRAGRARWRRCASGSVRTTPPCAPSPSTTTATSSASGRSPPTTTIGSGTTTDCTCRPRVIGWLRTRHWRPSGVGDPTWRTPAVPGPRPRRTAQAASHLRWTTGHLAPWVARRVRGESSGDAVAAQAPEPGSPCPVGLPAPKARNRLQVFTATTEEHMPRSTTRPDRPGERQGRPQLTREGYLRLEERATDIRERRLPGHAAAPGRDRARRARRGRLRAAAGGGQRHRHAAGAGRRDRHRSRSPWMAASTSACGCEVVLEDGTTAWVRPVHPDEAFLDDERISATSPLAIALIGARTGHTVWVDAPTGAWPCEVLSIDLDGVATRGVGHGGRGGVGGRPHVVDVPVEPRSRPRRDQGVAGRAPARAGRPGSGSVNGPCS